MNAVAHRSHSETPDTDVIAAWRVILVGVLTPTVALGGLYVVLPMLGALARLPGAASGDITWAVTAFALPYAVGFLLLGPLTDRFGPRAVMIASISAVLGSTVLGALAPNWPIFLLGRAVQGFAAAAFTPAILVLTQTRVEPARRLVTTSAIISAGMASAAIAQVIAQLTLPVVGVRGVFGIVAAGLAACLILVLVVIPGASPTYGHRARSTGFVDVYRAIPGLLTVVPLVLLLLVALSYLTVFVGLYAALQLSHRGGGPGDLLVLRIAALPAIAVMPLLSTLLVRIPARTRLLTSIAVAVLSTLGIGIAALSGLLTLIVFGVGMLLTAGAIAVAAPATVTEVIAAARGAGGAANALYSAAIFGGASIGTPLAARVITVAGTGDTGLGAYALTCAALLTVAGGIAAVALSTARR
ncbi:MAG: MFS transporter [Gordonia sp. (in: high G+C Gram-positive bacteria)]